MSKFRRMAWCAAAALAVSGSPAMAQFQQGNNTQGTSFPTSTSSTSFPSATTSIPNASSSIPGGSSGIPGASDSITGGLETPQSAFKLAAYKLPPSQYQTNNTAINAANKFRNWYGNVYYQGNDPTQVPNRNPGSFGVALFNSTNTTAGNRGAQGAQGARGAAGSLTDPGGIIVPLPKQIAYTSQIQFKMPAVNPVPQIQADLRTAIDRLPNDQLTNPAGVEVTMDGRNVVLRGSVKDADEARLVEGLVRLTPGVFAIKNELVVK